MRGLQSRREYLGLTRFQSLGVLRCLRLLRSLQNQSTNWLLLLGGLAGLGLGAGAFWRFRGIVGMSVCLAVLGSAVWLVKDAEPVLVCVDDNDPKPESTEPL